jgi:hypothetical protein
VRKKFEISVQNPQNKIDQHPNKKAEDKIAGVFVCQKFFDLIHKLLP